jgi:hypothetical protein
MPASATVPLGNLFITLSDPSTGRVVGQATLTCVPTGGTHPDAQAACDDLIHANGDIANIPPARGVACPTFVLPVTAGATVAPSPTPVLHPCSPAGMISTLFDH